MTITEMLSQSAILTVLGMSVVFAFLAVMIICMNISGKIISSLSNKKMDGNSNE